MANYIGATVVIRKKIAAAFDDECVPVTEVTFKEMVLDELEAEESEVEITNMEFLGGSSEDIDDMFDLIEKV